MTIQNDNPDNMGSYRLKIQIPSQNEYHRMMIIWYNAVLQNQQTLGKPKKT